jgi:hypothetical protein
MTSYDGFPITEAHRKALEAREKFFDEHPDELAKLPEAVRAAAPSLGQCQAHYDAADDLYSAGLALWTAGFPVTGEIAMQLAAGETHRGHDCVDQIIHAPRFE